MYITANWLYQPKREVRGLNVDVHRNPRGILQGSKDTVGPVIKQAVETSEEAIATFNQLPPGGNRVEAYLDLVFEDDIYDFDRIKIVLEKAKKDILDNYIPIVPLPFEVVLEDGKKFLGVFGTNLGILPMDSAEVVFRLLGGAIETTLWKNRDKLKKPEAA